MNLFKTLKKLKSIEPEKGFTKRSFDLIVGKHNATASEFWNIVLKNLEAGASLALAGVLIFMILGGFSAWRFFSPLQITALDPASIRAEAQAIDIQIQLTNLDYESGDRKIKTSESTQVSAIDKEQFGLEERAISSGDPEGGSSTSSISIDEALRILSE